jgi:hypothetical protein
MQTLYDRLKPELLGKLMHNRKKYEFTVDMCIKVLQENYRYGDLKIDEANMISTFTESNWLDASVVDFRHGSYLFDEPKNDDNE